MDIIFNTISTLLGTIYNVTGDWGLAIIFLTFLIKFILLPFSLKQRRGLEKQQIISKKMDEIKIKYKNDKLKMDAEIAEL
jgi:YidC/Oxa1 family membrane protein insertase